MTKPCVVLTQQIYLCWVLRFAQGRFVNRPHTCIEKGGSRTAPTKHHIYSPAG